MLLTPIVRRLLWVNIGLFLLQSIAGFPLIDWLGFRCLASSKFRVYQLLGHAVVHADMHHLFGNMLALVTFGPILESTFRSKRFLLFYILSALGAAMIYLCIQHGSIYRLKQLYDAYQNIPTPENLMNYFNTFPNHTVQRYLTWLQDFYKYPDSQVYIERGRGIAYQLYLHKVDMPTVGASGAIFALLTMFAMRFPNARLSLIFFPIPIPAKYLICAYIVYEIFMGVENNPADNVAHFVHLGGALCGYLLMKWWEIAHT